MSRSAFASAALLLTVGSDAQAATSASWLGGSGSWADASRWSTNPLFPCNGNGGQTFDVSITGGTATLDVPCEIEAMGLSSGTRDGSGELTVNQLLTWTGGAMSGTGTTRAKGGMALPTFNTRTLRDGHVLSIEAGTAEFTGTGSIALGTGGATLRNESGATLLVTTGGGSITDSTGLGSFVNEGTVTIAVSSISGFSMLPGSFVQNGALHVNSGSLLLTTGATHTGSIDGAGTMNLGGTTQSFQNGSSVTVARFGLLGGAVAFQPGATVDVGHLEIGSVFATLVGTAAISTGTMAMSSGTLSGSGSLTSAGLFTWTGGNLGGSGITTAAGGIAINGAAAKNLNATRELRIGGTGAWSQGSIGLGTGGATLRIVPGGTLIVTGTTRAVTSTGGHLVNEGALSFDLATSGQTISFSTATFDNAGTFHLKRGLVSLQGAVTQTAGALRLDGGSLASASPLALHGGALEGSGAISADVQCACTLSPGLPYGVLEIDGDLTLLSASEVRVDIHELDPNPSDAIHVTGTASLAGRLSVGLPPGLEASMLPEHSIAIVDTGAPLSGSFENVASGQRVITAPGLDSMIVRYGAGSPTGADRVVLTDFRAFEPSLRLGVLGTSQGGAIVLRISGVEIAVTLAPGMTYEEIAAAIAAAINESNALATQGIAAFATRNMVATNGNLDEGPDSSDPGVTIVELAVPALPLVAAGVLVAALATLGARRARRG